MNAKAEHSTGRQGIEEQEAGRLSPPSLGDEIRALRRTLGLTLDGLAAQAGLSTGFLSLVERDRKRPSLAALQRISAALGVEIGWFFPPHPSDDPLERASVVRKGFRRRIDYSRLSGSDYLGERDYLLSPSIDGALALTMMVFDPGGHSGDDLMSHEGEEAGYVLSGTLRLELADGALTLEAGDSFGFVSSTPHRYVNQGEDELRILLANTPVIMSPRRPATEA
ncbi:MAG: cupin domain-containing protein [Rhizobiales bacterium]|nr:cupin domain-containing protein [Hyphomicrobiales bacterium]